jgi:DHA1 family bicyclomycin/chloramphenicol resistance-like MFS transporter
LFSRALIPGAGRSPALFAAILGALSAFGPISIDMYLPAMPRLAQTLSSTPDLVQLTLAGFLLGFGFGQLFWGPLADRFGRKPILLLGLTFFCLATMQCATAYSVMNLISWRFVQALGACSGQVIARAMVRDVFDRDRAARMMSLMMLLMGAAPLAAPLLGGQLLRFYDWRAIFWAQTCFGLLSAAAVILFLDETLPPDRRSTLPVSRMIGSYLYLLRQPRLVGYIATVSVTYVGLFAYISGSPFVYIEVFGVSEQNYGFLFGVNVIGMMLGALVNSRLVVRVGSDTLLRRGTLAAALTGAWLIVDGYFAIGGLIGIMVPLFCFMTSMSFIGANSVAGGLALVPELAGTASALFGMIQFLVGGLLGSLVAVLYDGTAFPLALIIGLSGIFGMALHRRTVKG